VTRGRAAVVASQSALAATYRITRGRSAAFGAQSTLSAGVHVSGQVLSQAAIAAVSVFGAHATVGLARSAGFGAVSSFDANALLEPLDGQPAVRRARIYYVPWPNGRQPAPPWRFGDRPEPVRERRRRVKRKVTRKIIAEALETAGLFDQTPAEAAAYLPEVISIPKVGVSNQHALLIRALVQLLKDQDDEDDVELLLLAAA
jgi:hypothetical protein